MLSVITSALPTVDRELAFTFSIVSLSSGEASPEAVRKWQIDVKKLALKAFRDLGIETKDVTEEDIKKACSVVLDDAKKTIPRGMSSFNFKADYVSPEYVQELIELDKTFLEQF
ncbi:MULTISPECIES: hypothetical protein [Acetobacteraceae]|uniref:Uncharacterized protein n=1 Tax=Acetobacter syzygii TaxID=146476 RepID=A0A270BZ00_9PROT|nr:MULTISPECIES: hypothetical protein [Acetobacteraceae]PAL26987.1 hypothetical protein B9K04_04400 [Acetobacter syzygii]PAL29296.1 hypothetical protein B9K05_01195 [Acetobacter syzygii]